MEVSFVKQGAKYVAEFEVPGDFNLHLERKKGGIIRIYQRGCSQGEYDLSYTSLADDVFDNDFGALVYPKWIKVESSSEVVSASVNFNVGGGSGSGESGDDGIWYLSAEEQINISSPGLRENLFYNSIFIKELDADNNVIITTLGTAANNEVIAYAIPLTYPIHKVVDNVTYSTLKEYIEQCLGYSLDGIKWLTKEQFYSFE